VIATKGWFELEPATGYSGLRMKVRRGGATEDRDLPQRDHFALQMDHLSECVMENKAPLTPGEEGLRDLTIMMAIYEAAKTGKTVKL
jgi:glucose-fructose oxidoreductase